jgi:DNA-binding GntR family transcriptional regulator
MFGILKALNDRSLNATDFRILSKIQTMSLKNGYCWPSYEFLANSLGVSRRTAIYSVKRLVERGYLVKGNGTFPNSMKQGANRYFVNNNPE